MRTEQQEKILDAAERLFLQKGVTLTGVQDICAELDISKGTLYYHFANKNAIVEELAQRYIDKSEAVLDSFLGKAAGKPFETMIYECLNTVRLKKTSEKLHYMLMAYGVVAYPKLKSVIVARYEMWLDKIEKIMDLYYPDNPDNLIISHVIMSIFDGFAIRNMLDMPNIFENSELAFKFIESLNLTEGQRGNTARDDAPTVTN